MFPMDQDHHGGHGRRHPGARSPFGPPDGPPDDRVHDRSRRHRRGRGRGDVRIAVLTLLAEGPMHGYQLMHTVAERTGDVWRPSPGAIYPTLSQLEDEGLVEVTLDGGRKLAALTEEGNRYVQEHAPAWPDPFAEAQAGGPDLRELVGQVADATRHVGRSGDSGQREAAAAILKTARRDLYLVLAGETGQEQT